MYHVANYHPCSQMVEADMLETYTFLYTENYSCVEGDYTSVMNAIEDFKVDRTRMQAGTESFPRYSLALHLLSGSNTQTMFGHFDPEQNNL